MGTPHIQATVQIHCHDRIWLLLAFKRYANLCNPSFLKSQTTPCKTRYDFSMVGFDMTLYDRGARS